jgi:hypothetical protein
MSGVGIAVGFHVGVGVDLANRASLVSGRFGDLTTGTLFSPPEVHRERG